MENGAFLDGGVGREAEHVFVVGVGGFEFGEFG